jgi:hypothetical protein
MMKIQMTIEDVLRLARCAIERDNASGALKLIQDCLEQIDARKQEEENAAEETPPTPDVE